MPGTSTGTSTATIAPPATPARAVPTAPLARPRTKAGQLDYKAIERERKEMLAKLDDELTTFEIVDDGKSRVLLVTEVAQMRTPVTATTDLRPLNWLLKRIRNAVKDAELAKARTAKAEAAAACERTRLEFIRVANNRLTAATPYTDRNGTTEHALGPELLALLTTPVTAANNNLSQILWLIRAVNKSLCKYRGKPRQVPGRRA